MLIPCPHCGPRPHSEFTYGGDAALDARPDAAAPDGEWIDFLYLRSNPCGPHLEHWHHTLGCDAWIVAARDTLTHRIDGARLAGRQGEP